MRSLLPNERHPTTLALLLAMPVHDVMPVEVGGDTFVDRLERPEAVSPAPRWSEPVKDLFAADHAQTPDVALEGARQSV